MTTIILNIDMRYTDAFGEAQRHTTIDVSRILHATGHCAAHLIALHGDTCVVQFETRDLERANVNMLTLISRLCRGLNQAALRVLPPGSSRPFSVSPDASQWTLVNRDSFMFINGDTLED